MSKDAVPGWQKSYDQRFTGGGTLDAAIWPTGEQIAVGGRTALGRIHCASETDVGFPSIQVTSTLSPSPMPPLEIRGMNWDQQDAEPLWFEKNCFDVPA